MGKLIEAVTDGRWKTKYLMDQNGEIVQKECRTCGEIKLLSEFYPKKDCLAARRSKCNECELKENRQYHREDKPRSAARKRKWRDDNWEKNRETVRAWYLKNKDKINEQRRNLGHESLNRRRLTLSKLTNTWTDDEKQASLSHFGGCALTGSTENIQFDHVIPVSTGNAGTAAWNILPMTAELNQSKSTKHVIDWFYFVKDRYGLSEDKFLGALNYLAEIAGMQFEEYLEYIDWCHENKNQGE